MVQVFSIIISIQVYKLTNVHFSLCKILHQDLRLGARTTIMILIVDYREVILGQKVLNGIIHTLY
jgi:hypothetical protein